MGFFRFVMALINYDHRNGGAESYKAAEHAHALAQPAACRDYIADNEHQHRNDINNECRSEYSGAKAFFDHDLSPGFA